MSDTPNLSADELQASFVTAAVDLARIQYLSAKIVAIHGLTKQRDIADIGTGVAAQYFKYGKDASLVLQKTFEIEEEDDDDEDSV